MKRSYKDGKIRVSGSYWENAFYNVSNEKISVQLDGRGGLRKYGIINDGNNYAISYSYLALFIDGKKLDPYAFKRVEMLGREQKLLLKDDDCKITVSQFLSQTANGVYYEISMQSKRKIRFGFSYDCGNGWGDGSSAANDAGALSRSVTENGFSIVCSKEGKWIGENHTFYVEDKDVEKTVYRFFIAYASDEKTANAEFKKFAAVKKQIRQSVESIRLPKQVRTEEEKAFYYSCHFCALQNFKRAGGFNAFCAGANYLNVVRTYFRDSYWTVLPMYNGHVDLVRQEILTLSYGIEASGDCPSAVTYDFATFWGNHFDSPSFFAMMVYDYVNHTGDTSILNEQSGEYTVFEKAVAVLEKLSTYTDETGLIFKPGPYNKRDWADEVNRNGYVSYVEILFARSLYCLSELCRIQNDTRAEKFLAQSKTVSQKINQLLWDEEKGWYVNYIDGEFVEDNLSVDTVLAVIFGIADNARSLRILSNMEKYLETRNNREQRAGDYGIMCVWPFYQRADATFRKSSQYYEYHNGANWPYLSALYAYAQSLYGKDFRYALTSWFDYNVKKGNYTPIEYFAPCRKDGSLLQAWSGAGAFVFDYADKENFFAPHYFKQGKEGK